MLTLAVVVVVSFQSGAWVVRVDRARGQASLRNLQYPGYFLVHSLNSGSTVSAYMGDGLENADVGFML